MYYGKTTDGGQSAASYEDCANLCATNTSCLTGSFQSSANFCHMKTSVDFIPSRASGEDAIIFYSSVAPAPGCAASAPPSPYLINGGLEWGGYGIDVATSGFAQAGGIEFISTNNNAFEACHGL